MYVCMYVCMYVHMYPSSSNCVPMPWCEPRMYSCMYDDLYTSERMECKWGSVYMHYAWFICMSLVGVCACICLSMVWIRVCIGTSTLVCIRMVSIFRYWLTDRHQRQAYKLADRNIHAWTENRQTDRQTRTYRAHTNRQTDRWIDRQKDIDLPSIYKHRQTDRCKDR